MALLLAGQLFVALLLDHFGWAGFRQSPISLGKVAGLLLIFGGVWLIQRGWVCTASSFSLMLEGLEQVGLADQIKIA